MNIRDLISWGLVERVIIQGERKEHFLAEKDIWKVATQIIKERKKRELDPMLKMLAQLENVEGDKKDKHVKQFTAVIKDINKMGTSAEKFINMMMNAEGNWFAETVFKMFK